MFNNTYFYNEDSRDSDCVAKHREDIINDSKDRMA